MQVEVAGTLAKSNRVDPITACKVAHQLAGLLNSWAPSNCLFGGEVDRSAQMAERIEKQPTNQGGRIRVMAQNPKPCPSNLITASRWTGTAVDATDTTVTRAEVRGQGAAPLRRRQSQAIQLGRATKPKGAKPIPRQTTNPKANLKARTVEPCRAAARGSPKTLALEPES